MIPIVEIVYALCALTSLACAILLARGYLRSRARVLLWSMLCFSLLAVNNMLLFVDLVILPTEADLSLLRDLSGFLAFAVLVAGLVWDAN